MRLGLYLDLAVGARLGSCEVWADRHVFADGVSQGAPPDTFTQGGQDWGLAPFSPDGLRRSAYRPFVDILRATMRHARLVRIDHILGLSRAFWLPASGEPGGYVRHPMRSLLAITAIEAHRNNCVVVGEDLGLVPADLRRQLKTRGFYGSAVTQLERRANGTFRNPRHYREQTLASFGGHDMPTLAGFANGRDLDWLAELRRIPADDLGKVRAARAAAVEDLEGINGRASPGNRLRGWSAGDTDRYHGALARAPSAMVAVQLDDVFGAIEQQNLPGTIDEHPNWQRRVSVTVEKLPSDLRLVRTGEIMTEAGRPTGPSERSGA